MGEIKNSCYDQSHKYTTNISHFFEKGVFEIPYMIKDVIIACHEIDGYPDFQLM